VRPAGRTLGRALDELPHVHAVAAPAKAAVMIAEERILAINVLTIGGI